MAALRLSCNCRACEIRQPSPLYGMLKIKMQLTKMPSFVVPCHGSLFYREYAPELNPLSATRSRYISRFPTRPAATTTI